MIAGVQKMTPQVQELHSTGIRKLNVAQQNTFDLFSGEEVKSGTLREAYIQEKRNKEMTHNPSRAAFESQQDDNAWQKSRKSQKTHYENNAFKTSQAPFGLEGSGY